jgi:hypothetical protein
VLGSAVVLVIGLAGFGDWRNAFHFKHTTTKYVYPVGKVRRLVLDVPQGGDVHVTTGRSVLLVERRRTVEGRAVHAKRRLRKGVLTVSDTCGGHDVFGRAVCAADFDVIVPAGVALDVSTSDGDVTVDGRPTSLRVSTIDGDVEVRGCVVRSTLQSQNGDLNVTTSCAPTTLVVGTSDGDVAIRLPAGRYALRTLTSDGDVHVSGVIRDPRARRVVHVSTSSGDIDVEALR